MLAFVHIEKTAGTSFIHILRHNYFLRYMDVRPFSTSSNGIFTPSDLKTSFKVNPFLDAISGHSIVPFSNLAQVTPDIQYVTILRNPINRYLSQYRHWVEKKGLNVSIEQFMEKEEFWDFQTKKIVGSADAKLACQVLEQKFTAVGVVEKFNEFLYVLKRSLNRPDFDPRFYIRNTAHNKSAASDLLIKYREQITQRNLQDIKLYDYVTNTILPKYSRQYEINSDTAQQEIESYNKENPSMNRRYIDYIFRKIYCEPVTGLIRKSNGLPYKGSY